MGKRRLEKAFGTHGGPVKVRWLAFQLNPRPPQQIVKLLWSFVGNG